MRKRILPVLAITLVVGALVLGGCTTKIVSAPEGGVLNTVTSAGEGKAVAAPDQAEMSFGVVTQGTEAKKTLDEAAKQGEKIVNALKKAGVAADDIQTSGVSLYPQQEYREGQTPSITGYQANVRVSVKMKDIAKVGEIIEAGAAAGANEISGPTFTLSEQSASRAEAITDAVADAKARAEVMAKAAGKTVGEVISISETGVNVPPIYYGAEKTAALDSAYGGAIEPGTLDVTANVTVVFELK